MTMKDNDKSNDLKWMGSGCLDLVMTVWHVLHFVRMRLTRIIDMMYEPPYVNKSFWSRINFLYTHSVNILSFGSVGRETSPIDWSVRYLVLSKFCTMERISSFPFFPSSFCWPYKFQKYPVVHTQTRNRFPPFAAVETFPYLVVTGASAWPFNDHTGR